MVLGIFFPSLELFSGHSTTQPGIVSRAGFWGKAKIKSVRPSFVRLMHVIGQISRLQGLETLDVSA